MTQALSVQWILLRSIIVITENHFAPRSVGHFPQHLWRYPIHSNLSTCLWSSVVSSHCFEPISFMKPQRELSHVDRSELPGGQSSGNPDTDNNLLFIGVIAYITHSYVHSIWKRGKGAELTLHTKSKSQFFLQWVTRHFGHPVHWFVSLLTMDEPQTTLIVTIFALKWLFDYFHLLLCE